MKKAIDRNWVFNIPKDAKGWILDAICREIGSRVRGEVSYEYNPKHDLPEADVYFFAHYWNYLDRLRAQPSIASSKVLVWYTHPREIPYSRTDELEGYSRVHKLICTNSALMHGWLKEGLPANRVCVVLGGADPHLFKGHKRGTGVIGMSSSYYPRKGGERIHALIKSMPQARFCLLGKKWQEYPQAAEFLNLPNLEYREVQYADYPKYYRQFDVFLSMSLLEGGPIPVLEAMMSNVVPVASRTGFAQDLIVEGTNGFTFDVNAPLGEVKSLIEKASGLKNDIRETVLQYSWEFFAHNIIALADK